MLGISNVRSVLRRMPNALCQSTGLAERRESKSEHAMNRNAVSLMSSSKRDGLEKAVYRIEQAIKRSKAEGGRSEDSESIHHLENLLGDAQRILPNVPTCETNLSYQGQQPADQDGSALTGHEQIPDQNSDDHFAVDDAENPLQLLARASDLSGPPPLSSDSFTNAAALLSHDNQFPSPSESGGQRLQTFFGPFRPSLDVGEAIDPIEMGLATEDEAQSLLT